MWKDSFFNQNLENRMSLIKSCIKDTFCVALSKLVVKIVIENIHICSCKIEARIEINMISVYLIVTVSFGVTSFRSFPSNTTCCISVTPYFVAFIVTFCTIIATTSVLSSPSSSS